MNGKLHVPAALFPGKETLVSIGEKAERSPNPVWTCWRKEKSMTLLGMKLQSSKP